MLIRSLLTTVILSLVPSSLVFSAEQIAPEIGAEIRVDHAEKVTKHFLFVFPYTKTITKSSVGRLDSWNPDSIVLKMESKEQQKILAMDDVRRVFLKSGERRVTLEGVFSGTILGVIQAGLKSQAHTTIDGPPEATDTERRRYLYQGVGWGAIIGGIVGWMIKVPVWSEMPFSDRARLEPEDDRIWRVGFVATPRKQWAGFWGLYLENNKGLLADVKLTGPNPGMFDNYYDDINFDEARNIFGGPVIDTRSTADSIDLAYAFRTGSKTIMYLGAGYTVHSEYSKFHDPLEIVGDDGDFWVEDYDKRYSSLNILGGLIITAKKHYAFLLGAQTNPAGLSLGIGLGLP